MARIRAPRVSCWRTLVSERIPPKRVNISRLEELRIIEPYRLRHIPQRLRLGLATDPADADTDIHSRLPDLHKTAWRRARWGRRWSSSGWGGGRRCECRHRVRRLGAPATSPHPSPGKVLPRVRAVVHERRRRRRDRLRARSDWRVSSADLAMCRGVFGEDRPQRSGHAGPGRTKILRHGEAGKGRDPLQSGRTRGPRHPR